MMKKSNKLNNYNRSLSQTKKTKIIKINNNIIFNKTMPAI